MSILEREGQGMPDSFFRNLSPEEEQEFRDWARKNWKPGDPISPVWHPVVRDEIERMQRGEKPSGVYGLSPEAENFQRYLSSVVIVDGEGTIQRGDERVHVAIMHDGSGYNPLGVIYADFTARGEEEALYVAYDILQTYKYEHEREYYDEIRGDLIKDEMEEGLSYEEAETSVDNSGRAEEMFEEAWGGEVWTMTGDEAVRIISNDDRASKYIGIVEED